MKKKVLVISQAVAQWYIDVLTKALGDDVQIDIITGSEVKGNVIVSPAHEPKNLISRFKCWLKHYFFVSKWSFEKRKQKYDLIIATSNPPINAALGLKLKKRFNARLIYMNWDIYPQVIERTFNNLLVQVICRGWNEWNSRNYPKIDRVLTIGDVVAESIKKSLKTNIDIGVIPVAVDTEFLKPIPKEKNKFCIGHNLVNKFIVLYSGKMGYGHNIEVILETAKKLEGISEIFFVFIGEGPKYSVVEEFIKANNCKNILLLPLQPIEMFPYSIACADVGIVSQEVKMANLFVPSKVYSMMACGEVIVGLCSDNDDLSKLIEKNNLGKIVTDESSDSLANVILDLFYNPNKIIEYKTNSRNIAERVYSLEVSKRMYKNLFDDLLERNRNSI